MSTAHGQPLRSRSEDGCPTRPMDAGAVVLLTGESEPPETVRDAWAGAARTSGGVRIIRVVEDRAWETIAERNCHASQAREQLCRLVGEIRAKDPSTRVSGQLHRGPLHTVLRSLGGAPILHFDRAAASLSSPAPDVTEGAASGRSAVDAGLRTRSMRRSAT